MTAWGRTYRRVRPACPSSRTASGESGNGSTAVHGAGRDEGRQSPASVRSVVARGPAGAGVTAMAGWDQPRPQFGFLPWLAFFLARSLRLTVRFDIRVTPYRMFGMV